MAIMCVDTLQEQRDRAGADKPWLPPPIAVLPLGTGVFSQRLSPHMHHFAVRPIGASCTAISSCSC